MYIGRFAPSPTGALHLGSLTTALASWLDARAHGGHWLVRIEDVDAPRCLPGGDRLILRQLAHCGLVPDEEPVRQSQRGSFYQHALDQLAARLQAYPCACSRRDIERAQAARGLERTRGRELPYPGTCRPELGGLHGRAVRAWRFHTGAHPHPHQATQARMQTHAPANDLLRTTAPDPVCWYDRRLGPQCQDVGTSVGDFVLRRADGLWAYQLAVVVDDGAQGITHVVRGEDLADNTARQILLQRALGLPTPEYLHTPLVLGDDGEKLAKRNGAAAIDVTRPQRALLQAARHLGLQTGAVVPPTVAELLAILVEQWRAKMTDN